MARIPTYIALNQFYEEPAQEVKDYLLHLPNPVSNEFPYDIPLAYVFLRCEQAQNRTLYRGMVKIHRGKRDFFSCHELPTLNP
ncbi:hypothetical protein CDW43_14815 [Methylophaga nitratireducenticrescens]|nr:hypothetical protein CDW43_14815 [Methylophaga nitratireducenticrescens]